MEKRGGREENMSKKGKIGQLNEVNKELCYLLRRKLRLRQGKEHYLMRH